MNGAEHRVGNRKDRREPNPDQQGAQHRKEKIDTESIAGKGAEQAKRREGT